MILRVEPSTPSGTVNIPGSKSHTIRALAIAAAAEGTSRISAPLMSADTEACMNACRAMGADVTYADDVITVSGFAGKPRKPDVPVDVLNSGSTLRFMTGIAALAPHETAFDGDHQIRTRPMGPMLDALTNLGAVCTSTDGSCPLTVAGPITGGITAVAGTTSQFVSGLLLAAPLAAGDTEITVENLNEKPYVGITLSWLKRQGVDVVHTGAMDRFSVKGGHAYRAFETRIPADFSSATFPACAAAVCGSAMVLEGLDMDDPQGDKEVLGILESMGVRLERRAAAITVTGGTLTGRRIDLNACPDALPALAVTGCLAEGETVIHNVPQARIKETDRIAVMAAELAKMGADAEELPDGIIVRKSVLRGARVNGHHDHRIVMALSLAGLVADGPTEIETAESVAVTFPGYVDLMTSAGARMTLTE